MSDLVFKYDEQVGKFNISYDELVEDVQSFNLKDPLSVFSYLVGRCNAVTAVESDFIRRLISDGYISYVLR